MDIEKFKAKSNKLIGWKLEGVVKAGDTIILETRFPETGVFSRDRCAIRITKSKTSIVSPYGSNGVYNTMHVDRERPAVMFDNGVTHIYLAYVDGNNVELYCADYEDYDYCYRIVGGGDIDFEHFDHRKIGGI